MLTYKSTCTWTWLKRLHYLVDTRLLVLELRKTPWQLPGKTTREYTIDACEHANLCQMSLELKSACEVPREFAVRMVRYWKM